MRKSRLIIACLLFLLQGFVFGCATTSPQTKSEFYYLSGHFNDYIYQDIAVLPVIDVRPEKDKDIKDVIGYQMLFSKNVKTALQKKGYNVKELEFDTSACHSLSAMNKLNRTSCLKEGEFEETNLVLLITIDDYAPAKSGSMNSVAYTSGGLYSRDLDVFIWQDSINKKSGNEVLMFGGGGYLGGLLVKALAPNIIYRNAAFTSISVLLRSLPPYPKEKRLSNTQAY